jgi:hypothetical protein
MTPGQVTIIHPYPLIFDVEIQAIAQTSGTGQEGGLAACRVSLISIEQLLVCSQIRADPDLGVTAITSCFYQRSANR